MLRFIVSGLILGASAFAMGRVAQSGRKTWIVPDGEFPKKWRKYLVEKVSFYNALSVEEKVDFEQDILEFVANVKITGVKTDVDDLDKVLVAAGGVIPIFAFPEWRYYNLDEVLLLPNSFNKDFETDGAGNNRRILGMVGTGYMEDKMVLSKVALHKGFASDDDGRNTAIHEFIHLIDKQDGMTDGLPDVLEKHGYALPWLDLVDKKIGEIRKGEHDINPYGATSRIEFFAVLGEYFFEKPKMLQKQHPALYEILESFFDQNMAARKVNMKRIKVGRNDYCYCGSGKKYKKCCGGSNV